MKTIFSRISSVLLLAIALFACKGPSLDAPKNVSITEDEALGTYTLAWTHPWQAAINEMNLYTAWGFEVEEKVKFENEVVVNTYYVIGEFQKTFAYIYPDAIEIRYKIRSYIETIETIKVGEWSEAKTLVLDPDLLLLVALKQSCDSCWSVAIHIKAFQPEKDFKEIIINSTDYIFRITLISVCADCAAAVMGRDIELGRLLSPDEAKLYLMSDEYANTVNTILAE